MNVIVIVVPHCKEGTTLEVYAWDHGGSFGSVHVFIVQIIFLERSVVLSS